jgi:glycosyltransferase involved in cell wall biosynthesis
MRVAVIVPDASFPLTSSASHSLEIAASLKKLGCNVSAYSCLIERPYIFKNVVVKPLTFKVTNRYSSIFSVQEVARLIQSIFMLNTRNFDVVYERRRRGLCFSFLRHIPLVYEVNNLTVEDAKACKLKSASIFALKLIDYLNLLRSQAISTPSTHLKKIIENYHRPLYYIPNGVDPDKFTPISQDLKEQTRGSLGIPNDAPTIFYYGDMDSYRRVDILVEAFSLLKQKIKNCYLILIGDGPLRSQVVSMIDRFRLEESVRLMGRVPHQDIPKFLSSFDVLVAPYNPAVSDHVTPLKVLEAMACEKPVVTTAAGDIPLIIRDGENGVIAEFSASALCDAMFNLISSPTKMQWIGINARRTVIEKYTWDQISEKIVNIFEQVIQK